MEKKKNFLPVGTIVLLKNAKKRVMISGYCKITIGEITKVWDYCGYIYPEGLVEKEDILTFDDEDIDKVCYLGLNNEEYREYEKGLKDVYLNKLKILAFDLENIEKKHKGAKKE